ncbi:MAG: hypothetical protein J3Q66DRAFT_376196 [Benniella sp.]|nr:MAG: hypothetical protein J3Q66DRAFT_376196 [Benniella sp.]
MYGVSFAYVGFDVAYEGYKAKLAGAPNDAIGMPMSLKRSRMPFSWTWGQNKDFRSSGDILELVMFEFSVDACCQSLEPFLFVCVLQVTSIRLRVVASIIFWREGRLQQAKSEVLLRRSSRSELAHDRLSMWYCGQALAVPFMLSQVVVQVAERESKRGQRHAPTLGCADSSFMAPMGQVDIQHCLRVSGFADISPCISDCWLTRFQYSSIRRLFPHPGMAQDIHGCNRYWMKRTIGNKMRGTLENHGLGSKPAFTTSSLNIAKTLLTADGSSPLNHASKSAAETEDANSFKIFGLPSKGANSQPGEAPRRFIIEPTKKVYIHHSR